MFRSDFDEDTDVQTRPDGLIASRYRPAGPDTIPEMEPPVLARHVAGRRQVAGPRDLAGSQARVRQPRPQNRTRRDMHFVDPDLIETTPYSGPIRRVR
ncbi:MAG: hypothetical protein KC503_40455 [Myxococcales bacterium]|nr:hypothetical protein [Myxococcales bacterium]